MWISSKEFAKQYDINYEALKKSCIRANKQAKKICISGSHIIHFKYTQGKGHGGKTLQIWSKPLSKEEAKLVEQGFNIEDISNATITPKTTQEVLSKALNDDVLLKNSKALQVQNTNKTLTKPSENVESNKSTKEFNAQENLLINNANSLSLFAKASSKKQNLALQKAAVIKEWLHAKGKISTNDFINYINAKKI
ncbi:integrase, partial [Campylobacter jejuni]|nr:integrase [Campylobacter jejuni]